MSLGRVEGKHTLPGATGRIRRGKAGTCIAAVPFFEGDLGMDIPMKSSKRWTNKDVQHRQQQERAQAAAGAEPGTPPDAQRGRQDQGAGARNKLGRFGSSRSREDLGPRGPTAGT